MCTKTAKTPYFLPSEIARLVLGYIEHGGYSMTYKHFIKECEHLTEYAGLLKRGRAYPTTVMGKNLVDLMEDYAELKMKDIQKENESHTELNQTLWNQLENTIRQLKLNTGNRLNVVRESHQGGRTRGGNLKRTTHRNMRIVVPEGNQFTTLENSFADGNDHLDSQPVRRKLSLANADEGFRTVNQSNRMASVDENQTNTSMNRSDTENSSTYSKKRHKQKQTANRNNTSLGAEMSAPMEGIVSMAPACSAVEERTSGSVSTEVNRGSGTSNPVNTNKNEDSFPSVTNTHTDKSSSEALSCKLNEQKRKGDRNIFEMLNSGLQGSPHTDQVIAESPPSVRSVVHNIDSPHSVQLLADESMCPPSPAVIGAVDSPHLSKSGVLSTDSRIAHNVNSGVHSPQSVRLDSDAPVQSLHSIKSVTCSLPNGPHSVGQSSINSVNVMPSAKSVDNVSDLNYVIHSVDGSINSPYQQPLNSIHNPNSVNCLPVSAHPSPCASIRPSEPSVQQLNNSIQPSPYCNSPYTADKSQPSPHVINSQSSLNHSTNSPHPGYILSIPDDVNNTSANQNQTNFVIDHNVASCGNSPHPELVGGNTTITAENVGGNNIVQGFMETVHSMSKTETSKTISVNSDKEDCNVPSVVQGISQLETYKEKDVHDCDPDNVNQINSNGVCDNRGIETFTPLTDKNHNSAQTGDILESHNRVRPSPRPIVLDEAARHADDVNLLSTSPKAFITSAADGIFTDFSLTSFAGIGFTTPTKKSGDTQFSNFSTPFKSESLVGRSPKRKRPHPKKRSVGGTTKSSSENTSNESGGEKEIRVPRFVEKVINNELFTKRLAETINSTRLSHEHSQPAEDEKSTKDTSTSNDNSAPQSTHSVDDILALQAMSEDTVQRIIKMTEEDPALDGLFNLFNPDIPFVEKSDELVHPSTSSLANDLQQQHTPVSKLNNDAVKTNADLSRSLCEDIADGTSENDIVITCNTSKIDGEPITTLIHITEKKNPKTETSELNVPQQVGSVGTNSTSLYMDTAKINPSAAQDLNAIHINGANNQQNTASVQDKCTENVIDNSEIPLNTNNNSFHSPLTYNVNVCDAPSSVLESSSCLSSSDSCATTIVNWTNTGIPTTHTLFSSSQTCRDVYDAGQFHRPVQQQPLMERIDKSTMDQRSAVPVCSNSYAKQSEQSISQNSTTQISVIHAGACLSQPGDRQSCEKLSFPASVCPRNSKHFEQTDSNCVSGANHSATSSDKTLTEFKPCSSVEVNNYCTTQEETLAIKSVKTPQSSENSSQLPADSSVNSNDSVVCNPIRQLFSSTLQIQPDYLTTDRDTVKQTVGMCHDINVRNKQESDRVQPGVEKLKSLLTEDMSKIQCPTSQFTVAPKMAAQTRLEKHSSEQSNSNCSNNVYKQSNVTATKCLEDIRWLSSSVTLSPAVDSPGSPGILMIDEQKKQPRKRCPSEKQVTPVKIAPKPTPVKIQPSPHSTPRKIAPKTNSWSAGLAALIKMVSPTKERDVQQNTVQSGQSCESKNTHKVAAENKKADIRTKPRTISSYFKQEKVSSTEKQCLPQTCVKSNIETKSVPAVDKMLNRSTEESLAIADNYVETVKSNGNSDTVSVHSHLPVPTSYFPPLSTAPDSVVSVGCHSIPSDGTNLKTCEEEADEKMQRYFFVSPCGKMVYEVPVIETVLADSLSTGRNNIVIGTPEENQCASGNNETYIVNSSINPILSSQCTSETYVENYSTNPIVSSQCNSEIYVADSSINPIMSSQCNNETYVSNSSVNPILSPQCTSETYVANNSINPVLSSRCNSSGLNPISSPATTASFDNTDSTRPIMSSQSNKVEVSQQVCNDDNRHIVSTAKDCSQFSYKNSNKMTSPAQSSRRRSRNKSSSSKKSESLSTEHGYFYSPKSVEAVEMQTPTSDKSCVAACAKKPRANRAIHVKKLDFGGEEILNEKFAEKIKRKRQGQIKQFIPEGTRRKSPSSYNTKSTEHLSKLNEMSILEETCKKEKNKKDTNSKSVKSRKTNSKKNNTKVNSTPSLSKSVTVIVSSDVMHDTSESGWKEPQQQIVTRQIKTPDKNKARHSQFRMPNKTPVKGHSKSEIVIDADLVQQTVARLQSPEKFQLVSKIDSFQETSVLNLSQPTATQTKVKRRRTPATDRGKQERKKGSRNAPRRKQRNKNTPECDVTPEAKRRKLSPQQKLAEGLDTIDVGQLLSKIYT